MDRPCAVVLAVESAMESSYQKFILCPCSEFAVPPVFDNAFYKNLNYVLSKSGGIANHNI